MASNFSPVEKIRSKRPPINEDFLENVKDKKNKETARRQSRKFKQENRYTEETED